MSNMSYCRFENTAHDLDDCQDALERLFRGEAEEKGDSVALSRDELRAARSLVETCRDILELVRDEAGLSDSVEALEDEEIERVLTEANVSAHEADQREEAS